MQGVTTFSVFPGKIFLGVVNTASLQETAFPMEQLSCRYETLELMFSKYKIF